MTDNKNFIIAIILSSLIIFGWQYFYAAPQLEEQRQTQEQAQQQQSEAPAQPKATQQPGVVPQPPGSAPAEQPDEQIAAATPRVAIETASLSGSINLQGAQLDDLHLKRYRETVDPASATITLLSPLGTERPYFAENGWTAAGGSEVKLPDARSLWRVAQGSKLTADTPVQLSFDNGQGVIFHKKIAVDENYMFTITQEIENNTGQPLNLFPYSRVVRVGQPQTANFYILHEGLLGVFDETLQEIDYDDLKEDQNTISVASTGGWLGITDKYWAVALGARPGERNRRLVQIPGEPGEGQFPGRLHRQAERCRSGERAGSVRRPDFRRGQGG